MIFTNPRATMRLNNNQLNAIQQQQQQQRLQQINMKPLILFSNHRNFAPAMKHNPVHYGYLKFVIVHDLDMAN